MQTFSNLAFEQEFDENENIIDYQDDPGENHYNFGYQ